MARPRSPGGRPHKGERQLFATRLPTDLAELLRDEAEDCGLTLSDHLANIAAEHFGRPPLVGAAPPQEERLIA